MSINSVSLSGNIGREPEVKQTQGGSTILSFSLAVGDRKRNPQTGEWGDVTHWVNVVVFGKRAESLSRILRKGMHVMVDGKLSYSQWEAKDGSKRSKLEVIANDVDLPPRQKADQSQQSGYQGGYSQQPNNYANQQQHASQNGYQQPAGGNYGGVEMPDVYDSDMPFGG